MAAQGELEPAAQRGAVDRGDDGFFDVVQPIDHGHQMGLACGLIEFADIGAGGECASRADQHDRVGGIIRGGAFHAGDDALAHRMRQRVDRRVVDGQDGDPPRDLIANDLTHFRPLIPALFCAISV